MQSMGSQVWCPTNAPPEGTSTRLSLTSLHIATITLAFIRLLEHTVYTVIRSYSLKHTVSYSLQFIQFIQFTVCEHLVVGSGSGASSRHNRCFQHLRLTCCLGQQTALNVYISTSVPGIVFVSSLSRFVTKYFMIKC